MRRIERFTGRKIKRELIAIERGTKIRWKKNGRIGRESTKRKKKRKTEIERCR